MELAEMIDDDKYGGTKKVEALVSAHFFTQLAVKSDALRTTIYRERCSMVYRSKRIPERLSPLEKIRQIRTISHPLLLRLKLLI